MDKLTSLFIFLTAYAIILLVSTYFFLPETHQHIALFNIATIKKNYWQILGNKIFLIYAACIATINSMAISFGVMRPFIVQKTVSYSVVFYGYVALILGIRCFLGSLFNRALIEGLLPLGILYFSLADQFFYLFG